ncbi:hypothetical protein [Peribacillus sp. NPDC096540]|uniref:hypothetical protein n=1 Tax=Peribacillus sp. NPDC096540 TaxID=3390612 RepID=UPI003D08EDB6
MANNVEQFSSQLSAKIWGHRFKDGQRGPEYVLEFFNVIYGTKYQLNEDMYFRKKSTNLRKFIFEGIKEGSKRDTAKLDEESKNSLYGLYDTSGEGTERVEVIREFFRNLEVPLVDGKGKEADRSWYARTLYPLHESLLFFELRKNGESISYERNFFARGGELYYLMISYGTQKDPKLKLSIEDKLSALLTKNVSLERIVDTISNALGDEKNEKDLYPLKKFTQQKENNEYPFLPIIEHSLFDKFALELDQLLSLNIDVYEMFKLLTSLVSFQLTRYMYERSKPYEAYNTLYFFDCLDGQNSQILKHSANSFKRNELLIKDKLEEYFVEEFMNNIGTAEAVNNQLLMWKDNPNTFLELQGLSKLQSRKQPVIKSLLSCKNYQDVTTKLLKTVREVVSDQLKRQQTAIVRTLCRDGGLGNYKAGTNYRYTMTDNFIQSLVFANVKPGETMEFSEFLEAIYQEYGFVIGDIQAKQSGLYESSKLNISYYNKNVLALRSKLKKNGLLIEYSDATAMIRNPYDVVEGVVVYE